jgi:hypothetical protein
MVATEFKIKVSNWLGSNSSQNYVTTDGQWASLSWCQTPILGPRPYFYYCNTAVGLLKWGSLSKERKGLSFAIAAGPCRRSHPRVRVPRNSWPYFNTDSVTMIGLAIQPRYGPHRKFCCQQFFYFRGPLSSDISPVWAVPTQRTILSSHVMVRR